MEENLTPNDQNNAAEEQQTPVVENTPMQETAPAEEPQEQAPEAAATEAAPAEESRPAEEKSEEEQTEKENTPFVEPDTDYSSMGREELVGAFEALLADEIPHIKNRVAKIRARFATLEKEVEAAAFAKFLEEGGKKEDYQQGNDAVSQAYNKTYNTYRRKRQEYHDAVEATKQKNLQAKEEILEKLRQLIDTNEESLKKVNDEFKVLQDRWHEIGEVPHEKMNDLWQQYHFLLEQLFGKMKINRELRNLDMKRNLEQKILLCEQAEELIVETSVQKATKVAQELRAKWKEIGPVPVEQNEEIWQRFCNAMDKVEERKREYFEQRKEEYENNLLAKQALIAKAEELTATTPDSIAKWTETSNALDELLKMWKTIGPVPRDVNEETWSKFKGILDTHYAQKKEHFGQLRDEQANNYNRKIDLCLKAEAIALREDWKKATDELLELQKEWKSIGPVSRKVSDKIWKRFRGACDQFFERKTAYYNEMHGAEKDNLEKKRAIIEELKAFQFGDNKEENINAIKDFQRRWMEIGYVPLAEKEKLQKEFRAVIDGHFEKLKISAREAEENAFRERLRNAGEGAVRFASHEQEELTKKLEQLTNDVRLWENNMGFFSQSRQADILKQELEHKIQNTRQEIALIKAKLKILKEAAKNQQTKEETK